MKIAEGEVMIFVVLGTQKFPLNRLLKEIDDLVGSGKITEPVFAQIGWSDYIPQNFAFERFLEKSSFEEKIAECSMLITHSGVGTIVTGMRYGKPVVVFPRLKKYGEHVDDHQLEIAESFSELNYVLLCKEEDDLEDILKKCSTHKFDKFISKREKMITTITEYLKTV